MIVNRGAFKLTLYKNLKLAKTYGIAVGQVGLETPAGPLQHPEQGGQPGLARAELRLGGRPGRQGDPGRRPDEPDQGALDGHLRRRRHPRHVRRRVDRLGRLARLHPHARSRTSRSSTTRSRSARRSTSPERRRSDELAGRAPVTPISSTGTSCQPCCSREAWWSEWRSTSVPMNTPLRLLAHHRVPQRGRVAGPRGPGARAAAAGRRRGVTPASTSWRRVAT